MQSIPRILALALLFAGCATTSRVNKIDLGMSASQVVSTIGQPYKKQRTTDSRGNRIEVWSYQDTTWDEGGWSWNRTVVHNNVVFVNGQVKSITNDPDTYKTDNPMLPSIYALQQQQAINAYNARTDALAQPVNVNVQGSMNHQVNGDVYVHQY